MGRSPKTIKGIWVTERDINWTPHENKLPFIRIKLIKSSNKNITVIKLIEKQAIRAFSKYNYVIELPLTLLSQGDYQLRKNCLVRKESLHENKLLCLRINLGKSNIKQEK